MRKTSGAALAALLTLSGPAFAAPIVEGEKYSWEDYDLTLGAFVAAAPKYIGAEEYTALPLPLIDFKWKEHVFFNTWDGLGWNAYKTRNFRTGPVVTYYLGSSDRPGNVDDIDPGIRGGAFAEFAFDHYKLDMVILQSLSGGAEGLRGEIGASYGARFYDDWRLVARLSTTFLNENEMDTYFGLNVEEAKSLNEGQAYSPDMGFQDVTLRIDLTYDVTENWKVLTVLKGGQLMSEAADSPLVDKKGSATQGYFGMGVAYHF